MSDGIDMTHVTNGWTDDFVLIFDEVVELFIGGVCSWDEMVLVEIRIVWSSWVSVLLPKPLKEYCDFWSRFCIFLLTARIKQYL